jgi:hypothetical protein
MFFGWIKVHHVYYPETDTRSMWYEYVGPKNRWAIRLLYIVRLEKRDRLVVNSKSIYCADYWQLLGEGLKELGLE